MRNVMYVMESLRFANNFREPVTLFGKRKFVSLKDKEYDLLFHCLPILPPQFRAKESDLIVPVNFWQGDGDGSHFNLQTLDCLDLYACVNENVKEGNSKIPDLSFVQPDGDGGFERTCMYDIEEKDLKDNGLIGKIESIRKRMNESYLFSQIS